MEKYSVKFVCGHMSAGNRPKFDSHALGYIKLVTKDGTAVPDGFHDVQLYSVGYDMINLSVQYTN